MNKLTFLFFNAATVVFIQIVCAQASLYCPTDLIPFEEYNKKLALRTKITHLEGLESLGEGGTFLKSRYFSFTGEPIEFVNNRRQIKFKNSNKLFSVTHNYGGKQNDGIITYKENGEAFLIKIFNKDENNPLEQLLKAYYAELIGGAKVHGFGQFPDGRFYIKQSHLFYGDDTETLKGIFLKFTTGNPMDLSIEFRDKVSDKIAYLIVRALEEKIAPDDPDFIFSLNRNDAAWIDSGEWVRGHSFEFIVSLIYTKVIYATGVTNINFYFQILDSLMHTANKSKKLTDIEKKKIAKMVMAFFT